MALEGRVNINLGSGFLGGLGSSLAGGQVSGLAGNLGKISGGVAVMATAVTKSVDILSSIMGILTQSSGIMKGSLGALQKTVGLLLKPIGDIIGLGLMPLVFMLKPVAMFFNTMMKPYILQASRALQAGARFQKAGDTQSANEAFLLSFGFLTKPLTDALTIGLVGAMDFTVGALQSLGNVLISLLDPLGLFPQVGIDFNSSMNTMREGIKTGGSLMVSAMSNTMTLLLESMETKAKDLVTETKKPFENTTTWIRDTWGPSFSDMIQQKMNEATLEGDTTSPRFRRGTTGPIVSFLSEEEMIALGLI